MMLVACEGGQRLAGVSDSTFVETMADLRRLHSQPWLDTTARAAARDSILQSRGLTPEDLERASRALAGDPDRALEIWAEIDRRVQGDTPVDPALEQPRR